MMSVVIILVVRVVGAYRPRTRPLALALAFRSGVAIIVESNSSRASLNPRWYSDSTCEASRGSSSGGGGVSGGGGSSSEERRSVSTCPQRTAVSTLADAFYRAKQALARSISS